MNLEPEYEGIPYDLVIDGVIMEKNLKEIGRDLNWLKKEVRKIWNKSKSSINCNIRWKRADILSKERKIRKMKKEIITLIVILLLVVICNIITQKYTNKEMTNIEESLLRIKIRNYGK